MTTAILRSDFLETPETRAGGILVVTMPHTVPEGTVTRRAFLADNAVDRGAVLERFFEWFTLWGMPLSRTRGKESPFERAFALTLWPRKEPDYAKTHGPQFIKAVAGQVPELLDVIKKRRPRLVIFLSAYLWQAVTTPQMQAQTEAVCGKAIDAGRRLSDSRLAARVQRREKCTFLILPQPSKNTTDAVVASWAAAVQKIFSDVRATPAATVDPQLADALQLLILDPAMTVRHIASNLHVSGTRARELFNALENHVWIRDVAGRHLLIGRVTPKA